MTSAPIPDPLRDGDPVGEHPAWCVGQVGAPHGQCHHSTKLSVPLDELSGTGMCVSLRGNQFRFIDLRFDSEADVETGCSIGCLAVNGTQPNHVSPDQETEAPNNGVAETATGCTNASDPVFVTDAHGHDLTLAQAEILHRSLGYLLTIAGDPDAVSATVAA